MSSGFHHSHYFLKTCGLLFSKPPPKQLIHIAKRHHGVVAAWSSPTKKLSLSQDRSGIVQLWRCKSSFPSPKLAIPNAMSMITEAQLTEDVISMPREAQQVNVGSEDGWLNIGQYSVFAWSISGLESCIVIRSEDVQLAFDMGVSVAESVRSNNIFITHGHIDHIGAVANHVAKRSLNGMKPARYFVPPHLVEPLQTVIQAHSEMAQMALENTNIIPFTDADVARLNSRYFVKAFPTIHRVPSQGYIVYKEEKKLKKEYRGMEGFQVASLHRKGVDIHDIVITPEIAYCGDTQFDIFTDPPTPDLLQVKLLISEATFLDDDIGKNMVQKARDRGHTHLLEFVENADLFNNVGHIILMHFSNKYSPKYICDSLRDKLPPQLRDKVTPATVAKATAATTFL